MRLQPVSTAQAPGRPFRASPRPAYLRRSSSATSSASDHATTHDTVDEEGPIVCVFPGLAFRVSGKTLEVITFRIIAIHVVRRVHGWVMDGLMRHRTDPIRIVPIFEISLAEMDDVLALILLTLVHPAPIARIIFPIDVVDVVQNPCDVAQVAQHLLLERARVSTDAEPQRLQVVAAASDLPLGVYEVTLGDSVELCLVARTPDACAARFVHCSAHKVLDTPAASLGQTASDLLGNCGPD